MTDFPFPPEVQGFVDLVGYYLEDFKTNLKLEQVNPKTEAKEFSVELDNRKIRVIIHRTKRSFDEGVPEYRARMIDELPEDAARAHRGVEFVSNRFATVAALISWDSSVSVCSQLLIPFSNQTASAGLFAAAVCIGSPSILVGSQRAFQGASPPQVEMLSAWGDIDFEILHYDTAHLGEVTRGKRAWSRRYLHGTSLSLRPLHNNPAYGGGLLCLFRAPKKIFSSGESVLDLNELNQIAFNMDHVPFLGGWSIDGDDFVFTQFFPNFLKGLPNLSEMIIDNAGQRSRFIVGLLRDREMR